MNTRLEETLERLITSPSQGSLLEQVDRLIRRWQRRKLYEMLDRLGKYETVNSVIVDRVVPQNGKKRPALLRFHLPFWQGYDEVFWQALGDYIILALHRVNDVEYDSVRGKLKIHYFDKVTAKIKKTPEDIKAVVQGIAFLIDTEVLPIDYTRFRRMAERRHVVGEMTKEQAAIVGALLKLIP